MLFTNLFNHPTFQAVQLTAAIQQVEFVPSMLGAYGDALFVPDTSPTPFVAFAREGGKLSLIPTTPRGAPPVELEKRGKDMRIFQTHRLAKSSTVMADSLTGILNLPDLLAERSVQQEFAKRAVTIRRDMEFTHEYMRFGAVRGIVLDADGSVLDDFWQSWGATMAAWIELAINNPATKLSDLRSAIRALVRQARRGSKGGWIPNQTQYHALCGEVFYNKFVTHPAIEPLYLGYARAVELGQEIPDNFPFGGVVWHDYQGDDDGVLAIADNEAHLFPLRGNEVFRRIWGPAEFEPWINLPGQDIYALTIPDRDRGAWLKWEGYNYPLFVCSRPEMLRRMRIAGTG